MTELPPNNEGDGSASRELSRIQRVREFLEEWGAAAEGFRTMALLAAAAIGSVAFAVGKIVNLGGARQFIVVLGCLLGFSVLCLVGLWFLRNNAPRVSVLWVVASFVLTSVGAIALPHLARTSTADTTAAVAVSVPSGAYDMVADSRGVLWVTSNNKGWNEAKTREASRTVTLLQAATLRGLGSVQVKDPQPRGIAIDSRGDVVVASEGAERKEDPGSVTLFRRGSRTKTSQSIGGVAFVATTPKYVFACSYFAGELFRLSSNGLDLIADSTVGKGCQGIAACAGRVWVYDRREISVYEVDPETDTAEPPFNLPRTGEPESMPDGNGIACFGGHVCIGQSGTGKPSIVCFDPRNQRALPSLALASPPGKVQAFGRCLWVTLPSTHKVVAFRGTATTTPVRSFQVAGTPSALAESGGRMFVANGSSVRVLTRVSAGCPV
jgi:hypothetical protein